jgi:hypothetical protein
VNGRQRQERCRLHAAASKGVGGIQPAAAAAAASVGCLDGAAGVEVVVVITIPEEEAVLDIYPLHYLLQQLLQVFDQVQGKQ